MAKQGNPQPRDKWVLGPDFLRYWMSMPTETAEDFDAAVQSFQSKWPQLTEANIVTKMKAQKKKYKSGLPKTPTSRNRSSYGDVEDEFPQLVPVDAHVVGVEID